MPRETDGRPRHGLLRLATHNQGDRADSPARGWDVQCLTERSPHVPPARCERFTSRLLKGLAIDWDPDVLHFHGRHRLVVHPRSRLVPTPARGLLWVTGRHIPTGVAVAVVCGHWVNDRDGSKHPATGWVRNMLWRAHTLAYERVVKGLEARGYVVLFGGDVNDRRAPMRPLVRDLDGGYDALAHSEDPRVRLVEVTHDGRLGSDHMRSTATYEITSEETR